MNVENRRRLITRFKRTIRGARFEYIHGGALSAERDEAGQRWRVSIWRIVLSDGRSTSWTTSEDVLRDGLGLNEPRGYMVNKLAFGVGKLMDPELMLFDFGQFVVRAQLPMRERLRLIEGGRR